MIMITMAIFFTKIRMLNLKQHLIRIKKTNITISREHIIENNF